MQLYTDGKRSILELTFKKWSYFTILTSNSMFLWVFLAGGVEDFFVRYVKICKESAL